MTTVTITKSGSIIFAVTTLKIASRPTTVTWIPSSDQYIDFFFQKKKKKSVSRRIRTYFVFTLCRDDNNKKIIDTLFSLPYIKIKVRRPIVFRFLFFIRPAKRSTRLSVTSTRVKPNAITITPCV